MDVDIYFYFYDNTFFIHCKDPFCKNGIICRFYRRNNIISIQVSQIPFIILGPQRNLCVKIFVCVKRSYPNIGQKTASFLGQNIVGLGCRSNSLLINFFMTLLIFRIPVVSIVDHHRLFNRGFSFNFVSLVWAVFGGILRYTLKLNITLILILTLFMFFLVTA